MSDHFNIDELFEKYMNDSCSAEEFEALLELLSRPGAETKYPELWDHFFSQVEDYKDELGFDTHDGDGDAASVLAKAKLQENRKSDLHRKDEKSKLILRIAASVIIVLTIGTVWWQSFTPKAEPIVVADNTLLEKQTAYGERKEITLSDGSNVTLNAGSKLRFPHEFGDTRKLYLKGQAFFHVTRNPQKPFVIETNSVTVTVLGTSFDVKNFDDDNYTRVTVSTGKVKVEGKDGTCFYLLPNEQLLLNKQTGEFRKTNVDASKYTLWREGTLYFNNTPIADMIRQLERNYAVKINLQDSSLLHRMVSGEHTNENIWSVLKTLNFTHQLNYRFENNQIYLFKSEKNE